jgi:hypothetical protein
MPVHDREFRGAADMGFASVLGSEGSRKPSVGRPQVHLAALLQVTELIPFQTLQLFISVNAVCKFRLLSKAEMLTDN